MQNGGRNGFSLDTRWRAAGLGAVACFWLVSGCSVESGDDDGPAGPPPINVGSIEELCRLDRGPFSIEIDNPWFPLPVGRVVFMEGVDDGTPIDLHMTVLDETFVVGGISTRVLEEREREDGEIVEVSRNFFAQAPDGSVCYFGEEVDIYEDGVVVSHDGAWLAGDGNNQPGIIMPAKPRPGMSYAQELAPGVAEDHADHIAAGESFSVPAGDFDDTQRVREWTPLEPDSLSEKVYARGVGMIVDDELEFVSVAGEQ